MNECLSDADLDRFNAKEMEAGEATRVTEHLSACQKCARRNADMQAGQEQLAAQVRGLDLAGPAVDEKSAGPTATVPDATQPDSDGAASGGLAGRLSKLQELPDRIGHFKILEILGEGGMGIVYLAEQTEPIRRRVALKLVKLGMDSKQILARFESERQALALLDHPNIAKVFDAGTTPEGRPYFVMELVKGVPITEHCDRQRLTTGERLVLFAQVCQAVQHAHQRGIIHRDIKPSNILVTVPDTPPTPPYEGGASETPPLMKGGAGGLPLGKGGLGGSLRGKGRVGRSARQVESGYRGVPKIIDFGVAKATQQHLTERTLFTEQGQIIGTPEYMSPEQAEMTAQDVDMRTDVYSLGVVLYELLAGALPFEPKSLRRAGFAEIQRIIREEDPPKPSTRLSGLGDESGAVALKHRSDVAALTRELRGDLDWITMKAMEKDRTRRYTTATELADDILRHLKHEPVTASPPSVLYLLRKYVRRNRGLVAAAVVVVAFLSAAVGFVQYKKQRDAYLQGRQREGLAYQRVYRGIEKSQTGDTVAAHSEFEQALRYNPDEFSAIANLADVKMVQYFAAPPDSAPRSLLEESKRLCERALTFQPGHADIWNLKCQTLYALKEFKDAEQACREAIRLDPDNYLAPTNLAIVLSLQGRIEEALEAAMQSVATAARTGEASTEWAAGPWQTLATIQLHVGQPEAMHSLEKAFACVSNDEWGYMIRAYLRMTLPAYTDLKQALKDANTANSITAVHDARIKRVLALASLRNRQFEDAVQYAGEALELGGLRAAHHLIMAIAKAHLGDESAGEHFDTALALWPRSLEETGLFVTADRGGLWIDSQEDLQALRNEAAALLNRTP